MIQNNLASTDILIKGKKIIESPKWPMRGWHYHTMHPLELHHVLNGFDSKGDAMDPYVETWQSMIPQVDRFFEWLVANMQNHVEWILLANSNWGEFIDGPLRQGRLLKINDMAHEWGLETGADVPIALTQQNSWFMTSPDKPKSEQESDIRARVDWLMDAGFDFIATESGTSEFTHPSDWDMLHWMNTLTEYAATYNASVFIKVHCSTGQKCEHFTDPRTGEPLNFNFLPMMADSRLGIMPHTVQTYSIDDPAPTYGNENFSYILEFALYQAGKRPVVFHPETGYWVNYDIDVPLFLPLYGDRRLYDLRLIATKQKQTGVAIQGQMNFDSGWEWGYWLGSVITARASWSPYEEYIDHDEALTAMLSDILCSFEGATNDVVAWISRVARTEHELLIRGVVNGKPPSSVVKLNGHAYLEGWDTWSELMPIVGMGTQPIRVSPRDLSNPQKKDPDYATEVRPLLLAMKEKFEALAIEGNGLLQMDSVPKHVFSLLEEMIDSMHITYLRAKQVLAIFDAASKFRPRVEALEDSLEAIYQATEIVQRRESNYRVPVDRIASWRENPTVYNFGYLWTTHSLFYWWRDHAIVQQPSLMSKSVCYLNRMNPIMIAVGPGFLQDFASTIRELFGDIPILNLLAQCAAQPKREMHFPKDL